MPRISGPSGRAAARGGDRTRRTRQSSPSGLERTARDRPPKGAAPRRARRTVGDTTDAATARDRSASSTAARPGRSPKPEAGSRKPEAEDKMQKARESRRRGLSSFFWEKSRRRPTLPHGYPCSTIGSEELNFRVRDGIGCGLFEITTGNCGSAEPRNARARGRLSGESTAGGPESVPRRC